MPKLLIITHPDVAIDPDIPITDWSLNETGRRRAHMFASCDAFADVTQIWTSHEQKARETGDILAASRNLPVLRHAGLGENDRSATGFLAKKDFEAAADAFFAQSGISFRGWETAIDAQKRIHRTVTGILGTQYHGDLAIVTHGAVGTLLWCAFSGLTIDRRHDQPSQGHFWQADLSTLQPMSGWSPMAG
ncbi:MAG: histidine phosphatase family protein [Pseudomonadota bacterium]